MHAWWRMYHVRLHRRIMFNCYELRGGSTSFATTGRHKPDANTGRHESDTDTNTDDVGGRCNHNR